MSAGPCRLIDAQYPGAVAEGAAIDAGLCIHRGVDAVQLLILAKVGRRPGIGTNRQGSAVDLLLLAAGGLVDRQHALVGPATVVDTGVVVYLRLVGEADGRYGQGDEQGEAPHVSDLR
ncbi:hypothetical protein D3C78_1670860 [compost metagenome]